jgi:DNA-binding CsgD family transcriptional regulator
MTQKARKVAPTPTLSARDGAYGDVVIRLSEEEGTIGRREDNTYVIGDPRISRLHASLKREGAAFILTDLGSSAGTKVNGEQIAGPHVLHHGDRVAFGPLEFVYEDPAAMMDEDELTVVIDVPASPLAPSLSPRQQQVLEAMAEGLTNKEIGEQLGVTERTVKAYAQELYDKLDVRNRAGAVAEAMKRGLL